MAWDYVCTSVCDVTGIGFWSHGLDQWLAPKVSKVLFFFRPHPLQQLFHDYDLPDAGPLSLLDLAAFGNNHCLCGSGLADAAFGAEASSGEEQGKDRIKKARPSHTGHPLTGFERSVLCVFL